MRNLYFFLLLLVCSANSFAGPSIQPLQESETQLGCGCNFQLPHDKGERTFLQWLEGERALMRIENQLERLRVTQTRARSKTAGEISVGDSETFLLQNQRVTAVVTTRAFNVCIPGSSECESVGVKAAVKVKTRKGTTTVNATGACGC